MNLRCTIVLYISRKENVLPINYAVPLSLRYILASEMLKCGEMYLSIDEIWHLRFTQVSFEFYIIVFKLYKN